MEPSFSFKNIVAKSSDSIVILQVTPTDQSELKIVFINESFKQLSGYTGSDILGKSPTMLNDVSLLPPTTRLNEFSDNPVPCIDIAQKQHLSGKTYWVQQQSIPLTDSHGTLTHIAIIEHDITAFKKTELDYDKLTRQDPLSNLANSREFYTQLDNEFNRFKRVGLIYSVALIDIDSFHTINDTHGHNEGDAIIQLLGKEFLRFFRSQDTPARIGGDDFAVLLPDTEPQEALAAIDRFMEEFQDVSYKEIPITLSIGIANVTPQDNNSHIIMTKAQQELSDVKNSGGDSASLFLA
ncbi:MAG: sensor domain-containing diguanylate cyclase [Fibrobacterales bacterium]